MAEAGSSGLQFSKTREVYILDRSQAVALLIDYDNLQICAQRDAPGSDLDLRSIVGLAQRYGPVVVARAYAEWNNPAERLEAYKSGIEPAFAPVLRTEGPGGREGKSLADTVMVADGVDLMWSHAPTVFVLVTSDKDLIPLARLAKQRGAQVVVIGSDLTAGPLRELADDFFTYRRLVHEMTGVLPSGIPGPGRAASARVSTRQTTARRVQPARPAPEPAPIAEVEPSQPPELMPVAVPNGSSEDRPNQTAARRRRRRGGRGRTRSGQPGSTREEGAEPLAREEGAEPLTRQEGAEPLTVADEISPNGAEPTEAVAPQPAEANATESPSAESEPAPQQAEGNDGEAAEPKRPVRRRRRSPKSA